MLWFFGIVPNGLNRLSRDYQTSIDTLLVFFLSFAVGMHLGIEQRLEGDEMFSELRSACYEGDERNHLQ